LSPVSARPDVDGGRALLERAEPRRPAVGHRAAIGRDGRRLRNLEDGYIPPIFIECHGEELLDRKTVVRPKESIEWTRRLADIGLFVASPRGHHGRRGSLCRADPPGEKATIVTIECDDGWKYLSTGAWTEDIDEVVERAKRIIYF